MIHSRTGNKITTIDINALEYYDRMNGNSYFAGKAILNYGTDTQITLQIEYQYGYGDQYEWTAFEEIQKALHLESITMSLRSFCAVHNIILRSNKHSAKKAELKSIAKAFKADELSAKWELS